MNDEHSDLNVIGQTTRTESVARASDRLRAELESFVAPAALDETMGLAAQAAATAGVDDIAREMRAAIAGMLLNRVGAFMVATQETVGPSERITRPPTGRTGRNRAAA
jgi:hypothetical protein